MKKFLWLIVLLAGCAQVPEDSYVAYPGTPQANATVILTAQYGGYSLKVLSEPLQAPTARVITTTPYPTYTPWIIEIPVSVTPHTPPWEPTEEIQTFVPAPTQIKGCELRVRGLSHLLRSDHRDDGPITATIPAGSYLDGLSFYYPVSGEWAQVKYGSLVGWIKITSNILYDPQGPCIDLPAVFATPIPTSQPTATPQATFTPIGTLYVCPRFDNVNVREKATTSSDILGILVTGQRAQVKTIYDFWIQISYRGQTAYVHKDYAAYCTSGAIQ